jgi:hypothetical protein
LAHGTASVTRIGMVEVPLAWLEDVSAARVEDGCALRVAATGLLVESCKEELVSFVAESGGLDTNRAALHLLGLCHLQSAMRAGGARSFLLVHLNWSTDTAQDLHKIVRPSQARELARSTYKSLVDVVPKSIGGAPLALCESLGLLFGL